MTGNNGNNGNNGNTGNAGNGAAAGLVGEFGGGWFIEDRIDIPFVTLPPPTVPEVRPEYDPDDYDEFETRIGGEIRDTPRTFTDRMWTARWGAWRVLDPFAHGDWFLRANGPMEAAWAELTWEETKRELLELAREARDERAAAMGQILSQDVEFITDFMALLSTTPASHPRTYDLLHIGSQIGSYVALHYKARDNMGGRLGSPRTRPSQLLPSLMPPVPLPGHPAWPSGHATQSWLMAHSVTLALQAARMRPDVGRDGLDLTGRRVHLQLALQTALMNPNVVNLDAALRDVRLALQRAGMVRNSVPFEEMRGQILNALEKDGRNPNNIDFTMTLNQVLDILRGCGMVRPDRDFEAALARLPLALRQVGMAPDDLGCWAARKDLLRVIGEAGMVADGPYFTRTRDGLLRGLRQAEMDPDAPDLKATRDALRALALMIARNREIAGLHYPSDSRAGRVLADIVLDELTDVPEFRKAIVDAAEEWV